MLQLSGRGVRRIGTSYICASCLAASQSTRSLTLRHPTLIPRYRGRLLSSTCYRPAPTVESSTPHEDGAVNVGPGNIGPPAQEAPKKKKNKKKQKKANAQPKPPPPSKKEKAQIENERQLQVLQGALQALKNVLAAQNINVDQIGKPASQTGHEASKSGTKPSTKPEKAKIGETQGSEDVSEKFDLFKLLKLRPPDNQVVGTADTASEPPSTLEDKPTDPSYPTVSNARSRRALRRAVKRANPQRVSEDEVSSSSKPQVSAKGYLRTKNAPFAALRASLRALGDHAINDERPIRQNMQEDLRGDYGIIGQPFTPAEEAVSSKAPKSRKSAPLAIDSILTKDLKVVPIEAEHPPVPSLSYGLERVLFNPGVYFLQDPRSRVYNFDPYLSAIMPIQEFDFNALKQYVTSSKDSNLIRIAKEHGKRYTGSTSSMTSMLSHFHYLLSSWREINTSMLSKSFEPDSVQFTRIMRGPAAVFLHWKDGTYAIDADKEFDTANILSMLGKSMEKLLTLSKEEYERYRHTNSDQITEEERNAEEAFHYTGFRDFMMRSQLDAHDPRIPASGMFDLKTRAVVSIRMDAKGFQKGLGYEIRNRFGQWESFEREYYDMIRSAFLKYSLQVRMGRMDGIFVAFHNTQRIFGFQYIPLPEMDLALHGTTNTTLGNREYLSSLTLLNDILDRATKKFPERSLRMHFETRTSVGAPFMYIFAKPVTPQDIEDVQNASRASIEAFERDILGIAKDEAEAESEPVAENDDVVEEEDDAEETSPVQEPSSLSAWKEVRQMVEDAVDDDEVGVGAVREAIEDALEQSGLLHAKSSIEARGYVDALLEAITSSKSQDVESLIDTSADDLFPPTPKSETSNAEQSVPNNDTEPDTNQSQVHDEPVEQSREAEEQIDDKLPTESESESVLGQDEQPSTATSAPEGQSVEAEELPGSNVTEQAPTTETQIEEKPSESAEVVAERVLEEKRLVEEEENEDEDEEADDVEDGIEAGENKPAPTMSPLKELIVRMAQRIDEKTASEEVESSLDDSSKLKEFERILGELIARSKNERPEQEDSSSSVIDTSAESEDQSKAETTGSKEDTSSTQDSTEQSPSKASSEESKPTEEAPEEELLGMVLTIKNKVNGTYVTRPNDLTRHDNWIVEYNIEEISGKRAQTIYQQCISRRRKVFEDTGDKDNEWYKMFKGKLDEHTQSGREFRANETEKAKRHPVHIIGHKPLQWEDVFGKLEGVSEPLDEDVKKGEAEEEEDADTERSGCHL